MKIYIAEGVCETCGRSERIEISCKEDAYVMLNHQHECQSPRIFDITFREKEQKKRRR